MSLNNKEIKKIKMYLQKCKIEIEHIKKERENNPDYLVNKPFPFIVYEEQHYL